MIVRYLTNTTPIVTNGLATTLNSTVITRADDVDEPTPFDTFNINDYDCSFKELVVADPVDTTPLKNDKTSFLFSISLPSDTVELKLFKDCVEVADLNDNTYGNYFPSSFFPGQSKIGYILNWRDILATFGAGCYQVKADRVIINQNSTVESHLYDLKPYNEFITEGTVKLLIFSQGYIEGGVDYSGFEWEQSIRVRGKFWNPQATFETDNYQDSERNINQIQDEITTDYTLELEPIPVNIAKPLIYDRILGNRILIYDYNLFNFERYIDFEVYPKEIVDSVFHNRTGKGKFTFRFTDKKKNIIKRNFK